MVFTVKGRGQTATTSLLGVMRSGCLRLASQGNLCTGSMVSAQIISMAFALFWRRIFNSIEPEFEYLIALNDLALRI